jgi:hypothetical protein
MATMGQAAVPEFDLRGLEATIAALGAPERAELDRVIAAELALPFLPNPGPQAAALASRADVLLYGGQAGGGKSALEIGCAVLHHREALILRREAVQLDGLWKFAAETVGARGWERNKVERSFTSPDGRVLKFAGLNDPDDWRKHAGNARDYYAFDEAAEFLEEQVASLIGWLRSTVPGQRCRVILGSNPPRGAEGAWILRWFAPWLDPLFADPAAPGELRWAIYRDAGDGPGLEWVAGAGRHERDGESYEAKPSNVKIGQSGWIRIVQDGTGGRTLAYHADWEFAGGVAPTLSTGAGDQDLLFYSVIATGRVFASLVKDIS